MVSFLTVALLSGRIFVPNRTGVLSRSEPCLSSLPRLLSVMSHAHRGRAPLFSFRSAEGG